MDKTPPHPGKILFERFLQPTQMSSRELAKSLGLTTPRISEIIRGRRGMTAHTAVLLEERFGEPAGYWLSLQAAFDEAMARKDIAAARQRRRKP